MVITVNYLPLVLLETCTGDINYWTMSYITQKGITAIIQYWSGRVCQHTGIPHPYKSFAAPFLSKLCHHWNFVITQTNKCVMNKYICSKQWVICSNICPIVFPHRGLPRLMGRTNNFNNLNTDKMLVLQRIHLDAQKAIQLNLWFL